MNINEETKLALYSLHALEDDYDGEGTIAPPNDVLDRAEQVLEKLTLLEQEVYCLAPGPRGEIMIDCRSAKRSFEILLYPDYEKAVKFFVDGEKPQQGPFYIEDIPLLVRWLSE